MIVVMAVIVGVLFAAGTFLILQRTLTRIILGLTMCSNGVNMLLLLAGGRAGASPFADGRAGGRALADPMPQAMALTTIVINFGLVAFLLALAYRSATLTGVDEVEDDLEDRRIALMRREEEIAAEVEEEEAAELVIGDATLRTAQGEDRSASAHTGAHDRDAEPGGERNEPA